MTSAKNVIMVMIGLAIALPAMIVTWAAPASAAPAARTPVMYTDGMGPRWGGPARRPHSFVLGADYEVRRMAWSSWTSSGARGRGHLVACAGAEGPCIRYRATVSLSRVKLHGRTRYFASMTITGKGRKTKHLVMRNGLWTKASGS